MKTQLTKIITALILIESRKIHSAQAEITILTNWLQHWDTMHERNQLDTLKVLQQKIEDSTLENQTIEELTETLKE